MSTVGDLIKRRRLELDLTQEDLEERTGFPQSYISQVERGSTKRPGRDKLRQFARVLELPYDELLVAADYAPLGQPRIVKGVTPAESMQPIAYYGWVPADASRWWSSEEAEERAVEVPTAWIGSRAIDTLFLVQSSGDCLHREGIIYGTYVLCERTDRPPEDGTVAVVRVGDEITMKRWFNVGDGVELRDSDENVAARLALTTDVEVLGIKVMSWTLPD